MVSCRNSPEITGFLFLPQVAREVLAHCEDMVREASPLLAGERLDMEKNGEMQETGDQTGTTSPTLRGLVIAVIAAIILSLATTLLLGGSFGIYNRGAATECGSGSPCCPPAAGS